MRFMVVMALALAPLVAAPARAEVAPDLLVQGVTREVQDSIRDRKAEFQANPGRFESYLDEVLTPCFDVEYIGRLVLGKYARGASAEQKRRFQVAFKQLLFRNYASAMLEHGDSVRTEWRALRPVGAEADVTVDSRVYGSSGRSVAVNFELHRVGSSWKIYDIAIENLSLVTSFRAQVTSLVRKSGLDETIHRLESGQGLVAPSSS
jgi:phospholipid transport system substrate-binding protein